MSAEASELICAALLEAQKKMENPALDRENAFLDTKYASLASVRKAVLPPLNEAGISVVQELGGDASTVHCTTHLLHTSGQRLSFGPFPVPVKKADAQGFGAASTYARRYGLMAVACVFGDSDDDAESVKSEEDAKIAEFVARIDALTAQDIEESAKDDGMWDIHLSIEEYVHKVNKDVDYAAFYSAIAEKALKLKPKRFTSMGAFKTSIQNGRKARADKARIQ